MHWHQSLEITQKLKLLDLKLQDNYKIDIYSYYQAWDW